MGSVSSASKGSMADYPRLVVNIKSITLPIWVTASQVPRLECIESYIECKYNLPLESVSIQARDDPPTKFMTAGSKYNTLVRELLDGFEILEVTPDMNQRLSMPSRRTEIIMKRPRKEGAE